MGVTRVEISDHIHGAFGAGPITADDLVVSARRSHARPEVLRALETLSGTYADVRDLWPDLPGVPVGD